MNKQRGNRTTENCGETVPFSETAHVLVHTGTDDGVEDYYVCRPCYEDGLAPAFE